MEDWTQELNNLESYFKEVKVDYTLVLPDSSEIVNIQKFANAHIDCCRGNNGKKTFLPYLERLRIAKEIIG